MLSSCGYTIFHPDSKDECRVPWRVKGLLPFLYADLSQSMLQTLTFSKPDLSIPGVVPLAQILHHQKDLQELKLSDPLRITSEGVVEVCQALSSHPHLTSFGISNYGAPQEFKSFLDGESAQALGALLRKLPMQNFSLFQCAPPSEDSLAVLGDALMSASSLQTLSLGSRFESGGPLSRLAPGLASCSSLTSLSLGGIPRDDPQNVGVFMDALAQHTTLRTLVLSSSGFSGLSLAPLGHNTSLQTLEILDSELEREPLQSLARLVASSPSLTSLNLEDTRHKEPEFLQEVCGSLALTSSLASLKLSLLPLTPGVCGELGRALGQNSSLTSLDLAYCQNTSPSSLADLVAHLGSNTTLEKLNLEGWDLGFQGGRHLGYQSGMHLANMLATNSHLLKLDLEETFLGDRALGELAKGLAHNTTLEALSVGYMKPPYEDEISEEDQTTDTGIAALCAAAVGSGLKWLDLYGNFLGPQSARQIGVLIRDSPRLRYLKMAIEDLTSQDLEEIAKGLAEGRQSLRTLIMKDATVVSPQEEQVFAEALESNFTLEVLKYKPQNDNPDLRVTQLVERNRCNRQAHKLTLCRLLLKCSNRRLLTRHLI